MEVSKISTEEIVIGNTTYVVKTNAKNVSPEFVKKTIKNEKYFSYICRE